MIRDQVTLQPSDSVRRFVREVQPPHARDVADTDTLKAAHV